MLRLILTICAVMAAITAAACGGDGNDSSSPTPPTSVTRPASTATASVEQPTPASTTAPELTVAPGEPTRPPAANTPAPIATSTVRPAGSPTPPPPPPPPPVSTTLALTAASVRYSPVALSAPAGNVSINLNNTDAGISHNVHVFAGSSASGASLGATAIAAGPVQQTLDLGQLAPGAYFYRCDVHPSQMTGSLTVS